jgi:hypothetical protein
MVDTTRSTAWRGCRLLCFAIYSSPEPAGLDPRHYFCFNLFDRPGEVGISSSSSPFFDSPPSMTRAHHFAHDDSLAIELDL